MNEKGFPQEIPASLATPAVAAASSRFTRPCRAFTALLAVLALTAFASGAAFAQDSKPTIRGNMGVAWGWKTTEIDDGDPTTQAVDDIEGVHAAMEGNLFFEGSNGPLSYQFRMRFRGRENQEEEGDANLFAGNNVQTFRGYTRWHVADSFDITIGKYGGTRQTSGTENDPVQLFPYPLFTADAADRGHIDFTFKFDGGIAGAMIYQETAGNMSTDGTPRFGVLGGGGNTADNNNLTVNPYFKGNFGGIGIGARIATSSGDMNERVVVGGEEVSTGIKAEDGSFDALGWGIGVDIPLGGAGHLKVDVEGATNDLAKGTTDAQGTEVSEEEMTGVGTLLIVGGLRLGFTTATQEVGADEYTQTHTSVHYRIPVGEGGWVAPEVQNRVAETTLGTTTAETTQNAARLLFQIGF